MPRSLRARTVVITFGLDSPGRLMLSKYLLNLTATTSPSICRVITWKQIRWERPCVGTGECPASGGQI